MNIDDFKPENMLSTAFFTGHRFLKAEEKELIRGKVSRCLDESYAAGYRRFFCGCALGFDMLAALETIRLRERFPDVVLSLAIPCKTQADRWDEADRKIYRRILDLADDRVLLSPVYYQGVMLTRNRYMADRSSLCICWLTEMRGGTAYSVRYALTQNRIRIINLAVPDQTDQADRMREQTWNYMFTSPSAGKNAVTAPLRLSRGRKLTRRNM